MKKPPGLPEGMSVRFSCHGPYTAESFRVAGLSTSIERLGFILLAREGKRRPYSAVELGFWRLLLAIYEECSQSVTIHRNVRPEEGLFSFWYVPEAELAAEFRLCRFGHRLGLHICRGEADHR